MKVGELEEVIKKMQEKIDLDEGVIENLGDTIDRDNVKTTGLQTEVDVEKKNDMISKLERDAEENRAMWELATQEILDKSAAIRAEYSEALASFGAVPSPFPSDAEEGAAGLLDWLLAEFEKLGSILSSVSDNTAVMACESVLAILAREGRPKLEKIASRDYVFSEYSELEGDIAKVQAVKRSFLCKFWKISGREVVRETAR